MVYNYFVPHMSVNVWTSNDRMVGFNIVNKQEACNHLVFQYDYEDEEASYICYNFSDPDIILRRKMNNPPYKYFLDLLEGPFFDMPKIFRRQVENTLIVLSDRHDSGWPHHQH